MLVGNISKVILHDFTYHPRDFIFPFEHISSYLQFIRSIDTFFMDSNHIHF